MSLGWIFDTMPFIYAASNIPKFGEMGTSSIGSIHSTPQHASEVTEIGVDSRSNGARSRVNLVAADAQT
jgi:hypothetical protein